MEPTNILLNKNATASDFILPFSPAKAVNGISDPINRWVAKKDSTSEWISIDAGSIYNVDRWVVKFMGSVGWQDIGGKSYNMSNFELQSSTDNANWISRDNVPYNNSSIIDRKVTAFNARYFRILFKSGATINPFLVSVTEFEVYTSAGTYLSDLKLSVGTLVPNFSMNTNSYTSSVDYDCASIQVTPTAAVATSTITVNDQSVQSGSASNPIELKNIGSGNMIVVVVSDLFGNKQNYYIDVKRHTSAYLTGISFKAGRTTPSLVPAFNRTKFDGYILINTIKPLVITPSKEDPNATIELTCNGVAIAPSEGSFSLSTLSGNDQVVIKVTSTTGDIKNYSFTIKAN